MLLQSLALFWQVGQRSCGGIVSAKGLGLFSLQAFKPLHGVLSAAKWAISFAHESCDLLVEIPLHVLHSGSQPVVDS